ncbi:16S rRNA (uracil(1498)-N(3))-methyltransferase [Maribacter hydrothermalis]|uniref:Ribosomal RNA small subunit methyltransferase E n=1 Tax=Maribacter hydrothermalis TaxID=1836467 RepID=A0A1B7ZDD4_9FLAO|nr:16S rRNA (uracil(1498)-N(3))-methyltransferase [Maribacter hydrothermalis]APQ18481.1 16S rRNA (uracil(1498)-N(3))-methyltransferase [Maribacter hydrothermalis]OBR41312.1 16S rRNA (uracil(1498)-N(3))-methyltransferase [Maribacter hydrothermalis]
MQLFYNPDIKITDKIFIFDTNESKHIIKVLRKKTGDELWITNGLGYLFQAKIIVADIKKCEVELISSKKTHPKSHVLHMVVAPTKMNDRYEWFLEKATEIGVDEITPIICERSERKIIKTDRMQRVIESAMKQSLQTYLPKLNEPISLSEFLKKPTTGLQFIAHCEDSERHELKSRVVADQDITILIGPEGDFSTNEIKSALKNGYAPIAMGKTRLRTETAAIVACTIVATINNG